MKEEYEYTEIYRYNGGTIEKVIYKDNTISPPLFKQEATYILPTGEKFTDVVYIDGDAVKAMMEVVKRYEEKKAN